MSDLGTTVKFQPLTFGTCQVSKVTFASKCNTIVYSKACAKQPLKSRQNKNLNDKW